MITVPFLNEYSVYSTGILLVATSHNLFTEALEMQLYSQMIHEM